MAVGACEEPMAVLERNPVLLEARPRQFLLRVFLPGTEEAGSSAGRAEATEQRNCSSRRMPRLSSLIPGNPHSFGSQLATLEAYGKKQPAHVKTRGLDSDMINLGQLAVSVLLILSWR